MDYAADIHNFIRQQSSSTSVDPETGRLVYGVSVPDMRTFIQAWASTSLSFDDWIATLDTLYHGESMEEKTITGMILARFPKYRRQLDLAALDRWLGQLDGWREIDSTCQSVFTPADLLARWAAWEPFLRQLTASDNVNKRRASLVLLVKPVRDSSDARFRDLALELCDQLADERDKRITKAISWVLREAVKQHREAVASFIDRHADRLPKATLREVQTKLATGKKVMRGG